MTEQFEQAKQLLEQSQRILFSTHKSTDGDDLGTVLAMANHLQKSGKDVTIAIVGGVPQQLKYLPLSDWVVEDIDHNNFDLLVLSGCSNIERTGNPKLINGTWPTINIDHHPDNGNYATVNVVHPTKSSVAELAFDFFKYCNWPVTPGIATCLLTGIFTDTGSFMHSNTGQSTLEVAAELMRRGARTTTVAKHTYKGKDVESLKAWGKALENAYYDSERKIIYSVISEEEMAELGNPALASFEGLVETLNKVPEAKFAMFLKEEGGIIRGSLRSDPHKGIDVKKIAGLFGGGGHMWASGFSVAGKLMRDEDGQWQVVAPEQEPV
jgi:bifunctional oligoribonuclease and PAP phosphatase NrnA